MFSVGPWAGNVQEVLTELGGVGIKPGSLHSAAGAHKPSAGKCRPLRSGLQVGGPRRQVGGEDDRLGATSGFWTGLNRGAKCRRAGQTSQQLEQPVDRQVGVVEYGSERPEADGFVIGNNQSCMREFAARNNVATALPLDRFFQGFDQILASKIGRKLGHGALVVTSTYSLLSSAGIGSPAARTSST